ncbi:MAG: 30S ribosomal protein S16 [Parcubacteria group bacterium]|nr:30S ribosomal protein S16 [Parcubacteria group bacterium]
MLKIRLQRVGRKHEPTFRIVVTESQNSTKSGRSLEVLGAYDSRRGENVELNAERIKYWMSKGAKASGTMHNILVEKKIISGKKINVLGKKKPIVKEVKETEEKEKTPVADKAPEAETPAKEAGATQAPVVEVPKEEVASVEKPVEEAKV